jgi:hypothetical protein
VRSSILRKERKHNSSSAEFYWWLCSYNTTVVCFLLCLLSAQQIRCLLWRWLMTRLYVNIVSDVPNDAFSDSATWGCYSTDNVKVIQGKKHEMTKLIIAKDFFKLLCKELNKYRNHNQDQFRPFSPTVK